ncbi:hypothetical protein PPTG_07377 [Phytophthora nicotianae INRA-310]|uniref:Uncharacterized protein n=1 Tax=Phytophthora nicotianae (strain INRA-310) TaxID=761204 RepID=W2QPU4_PHYN3|nr:hypothetical protein PPTG_07377 [Phytophthora nicotianae INRA-310]ETN15212.1 hypothetical protein PPTG_07377 [Phytophthora nicotianae INRA-310]
MTVLPLRRIDSCEAQVDLFQNRWFSDHEEDMPQCGVTVQTGRVVYDVKMLKAMRSWHTAMTHFHGIENAIKWVKEYDDTQYNPQDPNWCDGILEKSELVTLLNEVNVLGDYYGSLH